MRNPSQIQIKPNQNQCKSKSNRNLFKINQESKSESNQNQAKIKPKPNKIKPEQAKIKPKNKKSKPAESQPPGIGQRGQPGPLRLAPGDAASLEWPPSPGGRPRTPYGGPCRDPQGTKGAIKQSFLTKKCTGNSLLGRFT